MTTHGILAAFVNELQFHSNNLLHPELGFGDSGV